MLGRQVAGASSDKRKSRATSGKVGMVVLIGYDHTSHIDCMHVDLTLVRCSGRSTAWWVAIYTSLHLSLTQRNDRQAG